MSNRAICFLNNQRHRPNIGQIVGKKLGKINRKIFQSCSKMPEETQAGPCAELTKALEACLAENVSLTKDHPVRIILRE